MNRLAAAFVSLSVVSSVLVFSCGGEDREPLKPQTDASLDTATGPGFGDATTDRGGLPIAPPDPKTCEEAASQRSYVGCDYWPTVTSNIVDPVFDFAVAVANIGTEPAAVTVTGNGVNKPTTVTPGGISIVYLPWVDPLKGNGNGIERSLIVRKGAYHLVSDKPVVVYQFSPLEFRAAGGEPGKDWTSCVPATGAPECYSYSNDASLLLPSTAMTGAYRVMGDFGMSHHPIDELTGIFHTNQPLQDVTPPVVSITATADNTTVEVKLGQRANVIGTVPEVDGGADASIEGGVDGGADADVDGGIDAGLEAGADAGPYEIASVQSVPPKGSFTITLNAGDVAQLVAGKGQVFDFSGSVVLADKPVQVIASVPCQFHPLDTYACDHEEETVFPAETLGTHYVVTMPSGPSSASVPHMVRFYGNEDGTTLSYKPGKPNGCPILLNAGEVFDCPEVTTNFEVTGDKAFGVGMFMLGGARVDPTGSASGFPQGDPSMSLAVAVEQYRQKYVFLAPADYKTNYVDIVSSLDTKITLDGVDISSSQQQIPGTSFYVARASLQSGSGGVHRLEADRPVGIQVLGYGDNTSFHYPGGLNLTKITAPPK